MDICFVLVAPAVAENVGAAARALKTMGFSRLRLVRSASQKKEEAYWMAHGAREILDAAQVFDTLEEALAGSDFSVATTARKRGMRHEYYPPEALVPLLREKGGGGLAVVFGCEESGLSNHDLELCDCISSVPLAASYPSLNLAQAVMIYAYVLSPLSGRLIAEEEPSAAELPVFQALKDRAAALLSKLDTPGDLVGRRILERLGALNRDDIKLAHSLCARLEKKLNHGRQSQ